VNWKLLYLLLLAHLLYDLHWQGPFIAEFKGKYDFILFIHALTWTMLLGLPLWALSAFTWWKFGFLLVTHLFIDRWKARKPKDRAHWNLIYVDQALHLVTMLIVAYL